MIGIMRKVSDNENALRTNTVSGQFFRAPQVGEPFTIIAESLTEGAKARLVTTSPVKSVTVIDEITIEFSTLNSKYQLEVV